MIPFILGMSDDEKKAVDILIDNKDLFKSHGGMDFIIHIFVDIGWFLTIWIYRLTRFLEDILDKIVSMGDLLDSNEITQLSVKMAPICFSLMAIIICILAFSMMLGKKLPISQLFINIILATLFIATVPGLFSQAFDVEESLVHDVTKSDFAPNKDKLSMGKPELTKLSSQVMASNITDLYWYAKNNFKKPKDGVVNEFNDDSFTSGNRDFTEKLNPYLDKDEVDSSDKNAKKNKDDLKEMGFRYYPYLSDPDEFKSHKYVPIVFDYRIVEADKDSKDQYKGKELIELSEGIGGDHIGLKDSWASGYYKRYQGNFFTIWCELIVLSIVYIFTAFKVARLSYEIATQKILAPWVAATDVATLQKVKQLIISIFSNYGLIALIFVLLKIFMILSNIVFKSDLPTVAKIILFFALALGTIDGPDEVKKILGIDAGVKDGYKTAMAGFAGAMASGKMAKATGKGTILGAKGTYKGAKYTGMALNKSKELSLKTKSGQKVAQSNSKFNPVSKENIDKRRQKEHENGKYKEELNDIAEDLGTGTIPRGESENINTSPKVNDEKINNDKKSTQSENDGSNNSQSSANNSKIDHEDNSKAIKGEKGDKGDIGKQGKKGEKGEENNKEKGYDNMRRTSEQKASIVKARARAESRNLNNSNAIRSAKRRHTQNLNNNGGKHN